MSLTVAFALGMVAMYFITGVGFIISAAIGMGDTDMLDVLVWIFCWWIALPLNIIRSIKNAIRRKKKT